MALWLSVWRRGLVVGLVSAVVLVGLLPGSSAAGRAAAPIRFGGTWAVADTCTSLCVGEVFLGTFVINQKPGSSGFTGVNGGAEIKGTQSGGSAVFTLQDQGSTDPATISTFNVSFSKDGNMFTGSYVYPNGEKGTTKGTRQGAQGASYRISGTISTCSKGAPQPCPAGGVVGREVDAVGPDGSGKGTTNAKGEYSIVLPAGKKYTVRPVHKVISKTSEMQASYYAPYSIPVDLQDDTPGVDFQCTGGCGRPTTVAMACEYRSNGLVGIGRLTKQDCEITVTDTGPPQRQYPLGSVLFTVSYTSASADVAVKDEVDAASPLQLLATKIISDETKGAPGSPPVPGTENCSQLVESLSVGVTHCKVVVTPGKTTKIGTKIDILATYVPADNSSFQRSQVNVSLIHSPKLDQIQKDVAQTISAYLSLATVYAGAVVAVPAPPFTKPLTIGVASTSAALTAVYAIIGTNQEPPDPAYAEVFRPRFLSARVIRTNSQALTTALASFTRTEHAILSWAGADWNALNRSVIAQTRNDRGAFAKQMLAASTAEAELASLLVKLPPQLKAVEQATPKRQRSALVSVSPAGFAKLKASLATPTAAQRKVYRSVGIDPKIITAALAAGVKHLTRSAVNGNVFAKLTEIANKEAAGAAFLKQVSARHAAIAATYK